jgi:hypothetical protein
MEDFDALDDGALEQRVRELQASSAALRVENELFEQYLRRQGAVSGRRHERRFLRE